MLSRVGQQKVGQPGGPLVLEEDKPRSWMKLIRDHGDIGPLREFGNVKHD